VRDKGKVPHFWRDFPLRGDSGSMYPANSMILDLRFWKSDYKSDYILPAKVTNFCCDLRRD